MHDSEEPAPEQAAKVVQTDRPGPSQPAPASGRLAAATTEATTTTGLTKLGIRRCCASAAYREYVDCLVENVNCTEGQS